MTLLFLASRLDSNKHKHVQAQTHKKYPQRFTIFRTEHEMA